MATKKINYVKAKETKERFSFYGNYYKIKGKEHRSLLCFVPKLEKVAERIDFFKYEFDVIFVMMNPGNSKPQQKNYTWPIQPNLVQNLKTLVPARPDPTQYQIASLAKEMKWESVCILNLSDRCETDSDKFVKELNELPRSHSIFSKEREQELRLILAQIKKTETVYLAWGQKTQNAFKALASGVHTKLQIHFTKLIGLEGDQSLHPPYMYFHPLQKNQELKEKWLCDFVELLNEKMK